MLKHIFELNFISISITRHYFEHSAPIDGQRQKLLCILVSAHLIPALIIYALLCFPFSATSSFPFKYMYIKLSLKTLTTLWDPFQLFPNFSPSLNCSIIGASSPHSLPSTLTGKWNCFRQMSVHDLLSAKSKSPVFTPRPPWAHTLMWTSVSEKTQLLCLCTIPAISLFFQKPLLLACDKHYSLFPFSNSCCLWS
jgi:hypothetical protein